MATVTIRLRKRIRFKDGVVLDKGSTHAVDAATFDAPVLDKAKSHPKVWGAYAWKDVPFYSVDVPGRGHHAVAASDVDVA